MTIRSGNNTNIGFAGFDNMISDISDDLKTISHTPKPKALPEKPSVAKNTHTENPPKEKSQTNAWSSDQTPKDDSKEKAGRFLMHFFVAAIIAVIIYLVVNNDKTYQATPKYSEGASSNKYIPPANAYKNNPTASVPRKPVEKKPPYGTNKILNREQIRYCLAQAIRIDAIGNKINNYSDSEVDKSNALVKDYNSRCGEYRYRSGVQSSAQRDIDKYKATYIKEGYAILQSWRGISSVKKKPVKVDQTVLSIQQRLTNMGYQPGGADGIMGRKTRAAIKSYQKDNYLKVDGKPTWSLLTHMIEKSNN